MPTVTLLPNAVTNTYWSGAYTNIDEGVDTHDGDTTTFNNAPAAGTSEADTVSFTTDNTATFTLIKVRIIGRFEPAGPANSQRQFTATLKSGGSTIASVSWLRAGAATPSGFVTDYAEVTVIAGHQEYWFESDNNGTITQATIDDLEVDVMYVPTIDLGETFYITAVEIVLTYEEEGGSTPVSFSDEFLIGDSWMVSGTGADNTGSWSETIIFDDAWTIERTDGDGSPDIEDGRTDLACRSCGTIVQITESLIFYADGYALPITWDGAAATVTTVSGALLMPYAATHRDRVWIFGDQSYLTGTVQTTSGITLITFSTAPPATILGHNIAINNVTFGSNECCQTTITAVNGVQATLAKAPNESTVAEVFVVFAGTELATLQWCDENDHTTWTDTPLPVNRMDGEIPTGIASVSGFLLLFKRGKTYRFDYGIDPNDENDRALVMSSETRGLVANKCCVVVEGTAYCMDQFGAQAGWWITRGGALFPIEIGGDISDVTGHGEDYQLDWLKSACWFGVYEPLTNAVWWFCTLMGDDWPQVAFAYNRPAIEGGDEEGHWMIHEFDHPCIMGTTAIGPDGVMRAYIVCADPDNNDQLYVAALSGSYGDMATGSQSGTVLKRVSDTVLDLGKHTEMHFGARVEINGVRRTVESDDTIQVTFTSSWGSTVVEDKQWRAGWKPLVTFKTIYVSPEPSYTQTTIDQCHALFIRDNEDAELTIGFESDGNTSWFPVLGGAADSEGTFANYERLVSMNIGVGGYEISVILQLLSPGGGDDFVHSVDIIRHKRSESSSGTASEMP